MNRYIEHTTETLTAEYRRMIAEVARREKLINLGLTEEEAVWFEVPAVLGKQCLVSIFIGGKFATCEEFAGADKAGVTLEFTLAEAKEFAGICKAFWTTFDRKTLRSKLNAYCKQCLEPLFSYNYKDDIIGFIED